MCAGRQIDMWMDMCVDMCMDMCIHVYADMRVDIWTCLVAMWMDVYLCGWRCRQAYR